jgi:hypothetical protein
MRKNRYFRFHFCQQSVAAASAEQWLFVRQGQLLPPARTPARPSAARLPASPFRPRARPSARSPFLPACPRSRCFILGYRNFRLSGLVSLNEVTTNAAAPPLFAPFNNFADFAMPSSL